MTNNHQSSYTANFDSSGILLVRGPASAALLEGQASCLGLGLVKGKRILIRIGKTLPFESDSTCKLEVDLSSGANLELLDRGKIGKNGVGVSLWKDTVDEVVKNGSKRIVVVGKTDSGKSTFCTFLINSFLAANFGKVFLLDADIGQADLGPPGSVSMGLVSDPLLDLRDIRPSKIRFVGRTSPSKVEVLLEETIGKLVSECVPFEKEKEDSKQPSPLVVNTDGYVGLLGLRQKLDMVTRIKPDTLVVLESRTASEDIGDEPNILRYFERALAANKCRIIQVDPCKSVSKSLNDRTQRRLAQYRTWLRNTEVKKLQVSRYRLSIFGRSFEPQSSFQGTFDLLERRNTADESRFLVVSNDDRSVLLLLHPFTAIVNWEAFRGMVVGLASNGEISGFGLCHELVPKDTIRIAVSNDTFDEIILSAIGLESDLSAENPIRLYKS